MVQKVNLKNLEKDLLKLKNKEKAKNLAWFFKTGKGDYGEGDVFLGITVPETRKLAKKYGELTLPEIEKLLKSKYHEARLCALLLLVHQYRKTKIERNKKEIFDFYLKNTVYINNWDLVDLSAGYIVGDYLIDKNHSTKLMASRKILKKLAKSKNLWERRIAMIATFAFIYQGEYKDTFQIAEILLEDKHDLIQKAVGWMLREVGKRVSEKELENFLKKYAKKMPRTTLRYAIERFPEPKRQMYLKMKNI